jgi:hypothetical protein
MRTPIILRLVLQWPLLLLLARYLRRFAPCSSQICEEEGSDIREQVSPALVPSLRATVESLEQTVVNQGVRLIAVEQQKQDKRRAGKSRDPTRNIIYIPAGISTSVNMIKAQLKLLRQTVLAQDACLRANARQKGIKFTFPHLKPLKRARSTTLSSLLQKETDFPTFMEDLKTLIVWLGQAAAINRDRLTAIEHFIGLEFTLFSRLPPELKTMIWKFAPYVPRIVAIKREGENSLDNDPPILFFPMSPPSPLLLTSKESRAEALKVLRPLTKHLYRPKAPILTNPLVDTVWILGGNVSGLQCYEDIADALMSLHLTPSQSLPRLAVPYQFWKAVEDSEESTTVDFLRTFQDDGTVSLILVVGDEKLSKCQNVRFRDPLEEPGYHRDKKVNEWYSKNKFLGPSWELLEKGHRDSLEMAVHREWEDIQEDGNEGKLFLLSTGMFSPE